MSLLTFLLGNWRVTAEAILLLLFISTLTLYRNAESEIDALKTQYHLENAVREAQAREAKSKSDSTLKRINDEHKTVVEQAEKNAWRNFTKRYGTGTGFNGCGSIGLRVPAPDSATPDRSEGANEPTGEPMAIDITGIKQFAEACGRDAGQVKQWQDWATSNQFPVEK